MVQDIAKWAPINTHQHEVASIILHTVIHVILKMSSK